MELVIEVVSTEKHLMGQNARHVFLPAGGVIGRSSDCDWVIPDQTRHLSGRHALVSFESGQFCLTDISTNGILLNGSEELAKNRATPLHDGDRLQMGEIQFQLQVNMDASHYGGMERAPEAAPGFVKPVSDGANPMDQVANWAAEQERANQLNEGQGWQRQSGSMADDVSPEKMPFNMPRFESPKKQPGEIKPEQVSPPPADHQAGLPDGWWRESAPEHNSTPSTSNSSAPNDRAEAPRQSPQPEPPPRAVTPSRPPLRSTDAEHPHGGNAVAAFAEGLGVSPDDIMAAGGVDFLRRAGELLRVALFGMVSASRTRALMKNEFRLDMTLVNATDNNPLKLSANGEQAVKHMLREEPGAFMPMDSAIAECFDDVKEHQLAMMAGMQGALLDLLDTVSPQELEKRFEKSRSGISLGSRSAKLWDAYCELHQELLAEDQLFASLFAEPFARAYDEQMNKLKQNRKTQDSSKGS